MSAPPTVNAMQYRTLGRSALRCSALGLGALHFGAFCDEATTARLIGRALDLGVNVIDTAPMYGQGRSETLVGRTIRARRHEVLIATKIGLEPCPNPDGTFGVAVAPLTRERIRSGLEQSLRALGTEFVDLYQLHAFDPATPLEETLGTLDELVREGKVRFVGCSNYDEAQLQLAARTWTRHGWSAFASFQAHYNLLERRAEHGVTVACRDLGVGLICNRALGRGILTGKYRSGEPLPEGSRAAISARVRRWLHPATLEAVATLEAFARERGRSATEIAIAWLLARAQVAVVLAGVRSVEQLETCARGVAWILSPEELEEIERILELAGLAAQVQSMPPSLFET